MTTIVTMHLDDRFWTKVDRGHEDECWEWQSNVAAGGYGQISVDGEPIYAHRLVMKMTGHDIDGQQVNHHCDNGVCVNPDHLYVGDQSDNVQDAHNRDRREGVDYVSGEEHGQSKLTQKEVEQIRESDKRQIDLADEYDVSQSLISQIQRGLWWSDKL